MSLKESMAFRYAMLCGVLTVVPVLVLSRYSAVLSIGYLIGWLWSHWAWRITLWTIKRMGDDEKYNLLGDNT